LCKKDNFHVPEKSTTRIYPMSYSFKAIATGIGAAIMMSGLGGCSLLTGSTPEVKPTTSPTTIASATSTPSPTTTELPSLTPAASTPLECSGKVGTLMGDKAASYQILLRDDCPAIASTAMKADKTIGEGPISVLLDIGQSKMLEVKLKDDQTRFDQYLDLALDQASTEGKIGRSTISTRAFINVGLEVKPTDTFFPVDFSYDK
jgi:hypothetical protein